MNAFTLGTLKPGTLLIIDKVSEKATIDGITSNWVKVRPMNDDYYLEGTKIKDNFPAAEESAWVFGGYLE